MNTHNIPACSCGQSLSLTFCQWRGGSFIGDMPDATVCAFLVLEGSSFTGDQDAEGMMGTLLGSKR